MAHDTAHGNQRSQHPKKHKKKKKKSLKKKKREDVRKILIAAPCEAIQKLVEEHVSSENVYLHSAG